jgi:hypothetical protein
MTIETSKLPRMHLFSILLIVCSVYWSACSSTQDVAAPQKNNYQALSKWTSLINAKAVCATSKAQLPNKAYVFPALRLDQETKVIDSLSYLQDETGALKWISPAPHAAEIQTIIQNELRAQGFTVISFQELTNTQKDHEILVLNPYYVPAYQPQDRVNQETGWSSFVRITAATYPGDLNPQKKIDLVNLEAITLYQYKSSEIDVIKSTSNYLIKHLGKNEDWSDNLLLLQ